MQTETLRDFPPAKLHVEDRSVIYSFGSNLRYIQSTDPFRVVNFVVGVDGTPLMYCLFPRCILAQRLCNTLRSSTVITTVIPLLVIITVDDQALITFNHSSLKFSP